MQGVWKSTWGTQILKNLDNLSVFITDVSVYYFAISRSWTPVWHFYFFKSNGILEIIFLTHTIKINNERLRQLNSSSLPNKRPLNLFPFIFWILLFRGNLPSYATLWKAKLPLLQRLARVWWVLAVHWWPLFCWSRWAPEWETEHPCFLSDRSLWLCRPAVATVESRMI